MLKMPDFIRNYSPQLMLASRLRRLTDSTSARTVLDIGSSSGALWLRGPLRTGGGGAEGYPSIPCARKFE